MTAEGRLPLQTEGTKNHCIGVKINRLCCV